MPILDGHIPSSVADVSIDSVQPGSPKDERVTNKLSLRLEK